MIQKLQCRQMIVLERLNSNPRKRKSVSMRVLK